MDQIHLLADCTNELRATIDTNRNMAEALTRTVDVSKEELQATAQLVSEAADALTVPAPDQTHSQRSIPLPRANSYAETVRQSPHAIAVAHCNSQARTIRLTHPLTAPDSDVSLNNLSEDVLVKKANLAIELAQKELFHQEPNSSQLEKPPMAAYCMKSTLKKQSLGSDQPKGSRPLLPNSALRCLWLLSPFLS